MTEADLEAALLTAFVPGETLTRRQLQERIGVTDYYLVLRTLGALRADGLIDQIGKSRFATYRLAPPRPPKAPPPLKPLPGLPAIELKNDGWDDLRRAWRADLRAILNQPKNREAA